MFGVVNCCRELARKMIPLLDALDGVAVNVTREEAVQIPGIPLFVLGLPIYRFCPEGLVT